MSVATALLLFTLAGAAPTPGSGTGPDSAKKVCVAPERTGTFRVTTTKVDGKQGMLALLLLEDIDGCLEATFVTDDRAPTALDNLSMADGTLTGRLNVAGENAKLTARFVGSRVAGSIVAKKQEWRIEGRKTS